MKGVPTRNTGILACSATRGSFRPFRRRSRDYERDYERDYGRDYEGDSPRDED
jgi:hypothetical protein